MSKNKVDNRATYRYSYFCRECDCMSYIDKEPKRCSHCGSEKITVNDHKKITSTARGLL